MTVLPIAVVVKFIVAGKGNKHTKTSSKRVENLSGSFNPNLQQDTMHIDNTAHDSTVHLSEYYS